MNIKEIAKLANVSIASVSRVLNNKPGVSEAVRKKVKKIIDGVDYKPNLLARGLVQKKSNVIGVMVPRFDGYYSERIEAILQISHENGYVVMIASAMANYEDEIDNLNMLAEKQVEGIIFFCDHVTETLTETLARISKSTPIVMVDHVIDELNIPAILQDNFNGAKKVMKYLVKSGHRRIACITSPPTDVEGFERYRAYKQVMESENLLMAESYVRNGSYSIESGYDEMKYILESSVDMPSAVFASNDKMAIGAINCIQQSGLRVPEDISVVGFDDITFSKHFIPSLTTVRQDQVAVGTNAAQLIIELIKNESVQVKKIVLNQDLVIRKSVKDLQQ